MIFSGEWEKNDDSKFSDLAALVAAGIPPEMRAWVYRDLLKVQVVELEEVQNYKRTYGQQYPFNKRKTIYQNYLSIS